MRGIFLFQVSREIPKSAPASQPKESAGGFFKSTLVGLAIFSLENDALKYSPQKISGIISNYEDFMSLLVGKEGLLRTKGLDKPESFQGMLNTWSEISSVMYSNFTFWSTATLTEAFTRDRELSFTVRIPQPSMGKVKLSFGGGNSIEIQEADLAGLEKPGSTISGSAYGLPFTLEKTGDSINISARGNFIDCDTSVFAAADALAQIGIKTKVVYVPGHALLKIEAGKGGKPLEKPLYIETTSNFQQRLHELGNDGLGFLFYDSEDQVRKNRGTIYCEVPFSDLLGYKTRTYVENDEEKNIASLSKYLESVPNDADAHDSRGTFYWRNYWQQPQKAISDFTRAIELCPSEPRFYFDRADPRKMVGMRDLAAEDYKKAGSLYFDKLDYQSAIDSCCRCLEIAPGDSDALILRAKAFELTGKFSDAIIDYEKALKAKPDSLDACISLARVHVILNQYGEAELAYSKALKLGSKKPEHLSGYADMLARGGQFGKALGYYLKTALAYESVGNVLDGARARHAASYCHQMAGDFSKAAQEYLMAARAFEGELKKGNPSVSIDAVISEYDGVLRIKPDNLESLLARGRLYYERHSNAEALSDFKKALGISPKNAQAYLYIGKIEASIMGEETYAEKNLKTASTLDPGNPEPHRALGDFYSGRFELPRRVDRASKEYLKAAQLEADPALASIDRANAFAAVGDLEKSLGEYSKAISFISSGQTRASSKQAAEIYIGRARLYESLGKPELAGKDRAKAGELWRQAPEEK